MPRVLPLLLLVALAIPAARGEILGSAAELRELTPARSAEKIPVKISGVVTSIRGSEYPEFTVQDETGGLVAQLKTAVGTSVVPGQQVEIEGHTNPRPPAPRIHVTRLDAGAHVGLPQPRKVNPAELAGGAMDCLYVELSGVIRRARIEESVPPTRIVLDLGPAGRGLGVWISHFDEATRQKLQPDAAVTVRGICNSWRSPNFQPFSTFIAVSDPSKIDFDRPAPARLEDTPARPLPDLLSLAVDDFKSHRERSSGVITLAWPDGQVVIESAGGAIRLQSDALSGLRLGDAIDATGFPTRVDGRLVLENALFAAPRPAGLAIPESISAGKLISESAGIDREGRLLKLSGTVLGITGKDRQPVLAMESGGRKFQAILPPGETLPGGLDTGKTLELTGVCRMLFSENVRRLGRAPDQFELQLQDARSILIYGNPPWWTTARLKKLIAATAVILLASIGWLLVLRRRVRKRGELLVQEIRARRDAELLAAERMRLASDLHDTLSQSLSGAAMQLEVVGALAGESPAAEDHLILARRLLDRSREDLRRAVWDLDPSALAGQNLASALQGLASEVTGSCQVTVTTAGNVSELPERVRAHLFRVGQEALNNALRHADPREVVLTVRIDPGHATLTIADDGHGFDPDQAPGPDSGHFGLRSLRERIALLGGTFAITSNPAGTTLSAEVPFTP